MTSKQSSNPGHCQKIWLRDEAESLTHRFSYSNNMAYKKLNIYCKEICEYGFCLMGVNSNDIHSFWENYIGRNTASLNWKGQRQYKMKRGQM